MAHKRFLRLWAAALALPALLLAACSQDDGLGTDGGERVAVSFTASMDGAALPSAKTTGTRSIAHEFTGVTAAGVPYRDYTDADGFQTRAFYPGAVSGTGTGVPKTRTTTGGDEWVQDDAAGIFMLTTGGDLTTPANVLANNVEYTATPGTSASDASFAPADADETIYYPQSGNVDFVAYYPYGGTGSGEITADYTYKVSVADQSDPAAIDLLWAKATNVSKSGTAVALAFDHKMSSVMLNVKAGDGIDAADAQSLLAGAVVFNGMPVTAELALQDGTLTAGAAGVFSPLKAATAQGGADATFSAILVPQPDGGTGRTVTFTVGGKEYVWNIPDGDIFAAGNHYTYPVTIRKNGITVGEPTITDWGENDHATVSAEPRDPAPENTVLIPAGTFKMGSPVRGDSNADDNEKPQHWVRLRIQGFVFIGK